MRAKQKNPKMKARYEGLTEVVTLEDASFARPHAPRFNGIVRPQWEALAIPEKVRKATTFAIWNDLFHKDVPDEFIARVWATMLNTPRHTYLLLTKRARRMGEISAVVPDHIWLGTTVENQKMAQLRLPQLMGINAYKWISVEPMLEPIDLGPWLACPSFAWVVCGPETGQRKRPCDPRWIEDLYEQCRVAGVPFFDKRKTNWLAREMPF